MLRARDPCVPLSEGLSRSPLARRRIGLLGVVAHAGSELQFPSERGGSLGLSDRARAYPGFCLSEGQKDYGSKRLRLLTYSSVF